MEHETTEALMPLTGPELTQGQYVQTLEILFPLISSWEQWSRERAPERFRPMLAARQRSQLLAADLGVLGGSAESLEGSGVRWDSVLEGEGVLLSETASEASFLGAMYVMEGSTLGGRFIARHVEAVLGLRPGQGDSYFRGHEEATGAMWREVTSEIAQVPESSSVLLIETAKRTFRAFGQALERGKVVKEAVPS